MVDIKDLQLHLEMHHGIRIPGFTVDAPTQAHGSATALAAAAAAQGGSGGGGENASRPGGGKKGGGGVGGAAGLKRSSRLAAVTQAKKDARLL
jgi:transcription initiation factor TFIID subunit 12